MTSRHFLSIGLAVLGVLAVTLALWHLRDADAGVTREEVTIGHIPATIFRPATRGAPAPAIVIAHGFAGSQQLMQSFALTCAKNGYIAVTYDFAGHGRNPEPLTGSITQQDGATRTLVRETAQVADLARAIGDGRIAVLGHSMASDIVVRFASEHPDVAATIAVSMFSPAVTAEAPRNLLVLVGAWEGMLKEEALRAVGLAAPPGDAVAAGVTYGDFARGTARRAEFVDGAEHVSVLYREDGLRAALSWLDGAFGFSRPAVATVDERGAWIALLFAGIALLAKPLSLLLPVVAVPAAGAGLAWRQLLVPLVLPAIATPLVLRFLPTHFLPVLVGDYLAVHFGTYGLLTAALLLRLAEARERERPAPLVSATAFATATLALLAFYVVFVFLPIDSYFTSFTPTAARVPLIAAMAAGTLLFFLADEWLVRGEGGPRGAYLATKIAFLLSLGIAVALDFERLFFLLIIVPAIVLSFLFFGLISSWTYQRTRHPWVAGIANGLAIAAAIGVVFPMVAG